MTSRQRQSGLGFASSWADNWGGDWGEYGIGSDFIDGINYWSDFSSGGGFDGGGGDWWSNFDPITGDYVGGLDYNNLPGDLFSNYQGGWWTNFNPETGDYEPFTPGPSLFEPISTNEPASLPEIPSGDWWKDLITPWTFDPFTYEPTGYDPFVIPPDPTSPNLPGYCPAGTYHPISNPFSCVPFPNSQQSGQTTAPQRPQQRTGTQPQRQQQQPRPPQQQQCPTGQEFNAQLQRCVPKCPQGQVFVPAAGRCVTPPQCAAGMTFDPRTGQCAKAHSLAETVKGIPWWVWAIGALVVVKATQDSPSRSGRGRR